MRVDPFRQIGKTPVAIGSKVPICPAFLTLRTFFTDWTTEKELGPSALFIQTIILSVQFINDLRYFFYVLRAFINPEIKAGDIFHGKVLSQILPDKPARAL